MTELKLADGQEELERRAAIGEECIRLGYFGVDLDDLCAVMPDDRETAAKDAISDVLTALFGPAGVHTVGGALEPNRFALNEARRVVEEAFRSWEGDAEDYTREPEPGEYGYEGND